MTDCVNYEKYVTIYYLTYEGMIRSDRVIIQGSCVDYLWYFMSKNDHGQILSLNDHGS